MIPRSTLFLLTFLILVSCFCSCSDIIEPSLTKKQVTVEAPFDKYQSTAYTINFWWDQLNNATGYRLQVVTPNFTAPASLVLDTLVSTYKFSYNFNPGIYQWHVRAENSSTQTPYTTPRNFTVVSSSITQQTIQLSSPANNLITNQVSVFFQWNSLYGATQYRFEIDTNNFINQGSIVSNQVIPGQQLNFTFPKDQNYQWRVRAENDTAQSQWSSVFTITYDHTPPAQVATVSPANGQTVTLPVSLKWTSVPTAVKYNVYVFKSDSTSLYSSSYPASVTGTGYSFNAGNSGDKVYWKVTTLDAAGNEGTASVLRSFILQ